MIRFAIIDNEAFWQKEIERVLQNFFASTDKKYQMKFFFDAESFLGETQIFDFVFMDIELDKMNGLEAAKYYKEKYPNTILVLVTTHEELSTEGYKVQAFRYIRKTKLEEEIEEALNSAMSFFKSHNRIRVSVINQGIWEIRCSDILFMETEKRHTLVHTTEGTYITKEKITDMYEELEKYGFIYPHKSYLVSLQWVDNIVDKNTIVLKNGQEVPVSQKKKKEIWMQIKQWKLKYSGR